MEEMKIGTVIELNGDVKALITGLVRGRDLDYTLYFCAKRGRKYFHFMGFKDSDAYLGKTSYKVPISVIEGLREKQDAIFAVLPEEEGQMQLEALMTRMLSQLQKLKKKKNSHDWSVVHLLNQLQILTDVLANADINSPLISKVVLVI